MGSDIDSDIIGAATRKSVAWKLFCGAALASLVLVAAACGDSNTPGPDNQVQTVTVELSGAIGTANFRLQAP